MKVALIFVFPAILGTLAERSELAKTCLPQVPSKCPGSGTLAGCPTCCCSSSNNVEFYDPTRAEPVCTAPLALYEMKFVFTWSSDCQPDYIFSNSHWSPPAAATHSQNYRMWDACMDNPSEGVGLVSRTGNTSVINMEIIEQGFQGHILDFTMFDTYPIQNGVNNISIYLTADQDHQWVSAISMLAPSPDRMVGVADLRLCDGERWRERVKVCLELFSTATASEKVVGAMERNSIQFNNCSFGHIEFNLIKQGQELVSESSAVTRAVNVGIISLAVALVLIFK